LAKSVTEIRKFIVGSFCRGGCDSDSTQNSAASNLQAELIAMEHKELELDSLIEKASEYFECLVFAKQIVCCLLLCAETELLVLSEDTRLAYVTYHDLRNLVGLQSQTVLAIKAPPEAELNVPEVNGKVAICTCK
jgi:E2F transcription factor CC-MB domain